MKDPQAARLETALNEFVDRNMALRRRSRKELAIGITVIVLTITITVIVAARANANPPAYPAPTYPGVGTAVVPVVTAVYTPESGQSADIAAAIRELTAEVRQLRAELAAVRQPAVALPLKAAADPLAIATRNCSACHSPKAAEDKGGGFALFTDGGQFAPLSARDRQRAAARVSNGSMPPKPSPPLGAADKAALADSFRKGG